LKPGSRIAVIGADADDLGVLQISHAWELLRPASRPWPMG
jgi:hypothetical protein